MTLTSGEINFLFFIALATSSHIFYSPATSYLDIYLSHFFPLKQKLKIRFCYSSEDVIFTARVLSRKNIMLVFARHISRKKKKSYLLVRQTTIKREESICHKSNNFLLSVIKVASKMKREILIEFIDFFANSFQLIMSSC